MDELTPKLEADEYIVLKGQSEPKGTFIDGNFTNLVYSLFGIFCMTKLCIIKLCGITFSSEVISLIFFICIYALYVFILHRICLKSDKYQYYWITNKNFYYKNIYSICNSRTFDAVFEITDIQKINLSDIYEFESLYRIGDRDFHLKSLIIKYNSIDAETGEQDIAQLEIRHLEDYENVLQTISDMRKDG